MGDNLDDLFVIDKQGSSVVEKQSTILYDFKKDESAPEDVKTPLKRNRRILGGKRYHEAEDIFKFRPGKLSRELRKALNIGKHDIPVHVYRMRTLGYPPGWLRKAMVNGDLKMIDSVIGSDTVSQTKISYNREALIAYPGFNVTPDRSVRDHCVYFRCPPMQKHHMLDNFYAALSSTVERQQGEAVNANEANYSNLLELQAERERILAEIRQLDSKITPHDSNTNESDGKLSESDGNRFSESDQSSGHKPPFESEPSGNKLDEVSVEPEHDDTVFAICTSEEGTPTPYLPIITEDGLRDGSSGFSPCLSKRPSIEAFTMGIQPFRPFENLPGSQGGYQRVLKTLRNSQLNHQTPSSYEACTSECNSAQFKSPLLKNPHD